MKLPGLLWIRRTALVLATVASAANVGMAQDRGGHGWPVRNCHGISLARPGSGVPYAGLVENDDYGLRVTIPRGLTGGGASFDAPFHGFAIFLPPEDTLTSCIEFEIHLHVDLGDEGGSSPPAGSARTVKVGNVRGRREEANGVVDGIPLKNILITFSVRRGQEILDGSIWFVNTGKTVRDRAAVTALFNAFVSGIEFSEASRQP
jgi:hypothetical protein